MNINQNDLSFQEIKTIFKENNNGVGDTIFDLFKCFNIVQLCRKAGIFKAKGFKVEEIMIVFLVLPLMLIDTIRGFITSSYPLTQAKKDVFYRFLNNEWINWRKLLYTTAKRFRKLTPPPENEPVITCGIIDDSVIRKTGFKIEGIGKVFDHVSRKSVLGFKCPLLSFWDGKSIFPLDFSYHAEKGKNKKRPYGLTLKKLKARFSKARALDVPGNKRISELKQSKIVASIAMIRRAAKNGFIPNYILTDSWFTVGKLISAVRKIRQGSIHFLGMARQDKRCYVYNNKKHNASELKKMLKSEAKRCRKINARYFEVIVEYQNIGRLKLFFTRFSHQNKWQLMVTTDLSLSYIKAMEIYSLRWGIEVLFKECKQHLKLGKTQSNDFDAQIAGTTISFMLYTMLAFYKRMHAYETLGSLFTHLKEQLLESTIAERLWFVFLELQSLIAEFFGQDLNECLHRLINSEKGEQLLRSMVYVIPLPPTEKPVDKAA